VDIYGIEVGLAEPVVVSRPLLVLRLLVHIHNLGRVLHGLGESSEVRDLRLLSLRTFLLEQLIQRVAKTLFGVSSLQSQVYPWVNLLDYVGASLSGARTLCLPVLRLGGGKTVDLVKPLLRFCSILHDELLCSVAVHGNGREFVLSLRSCSVLSCLGHAARVLASPVLLLLGLR
jgi:hypothetical protein